MVAREKKRKKPAGAASAASVLLSLQASGFAVTILILLVAGVVILSPALRVLAEQQQEISQLEDTLAASSLEVVQLEEQRERWKDPAYVETQARERLMFVYPGDITYLVIDDLESDLENSELDISPELVHASTDWRESLLASYLIAATTSRSTEALEPETSPLIPSPDLGATQ